MGPWSSRSVAPDAKRPELGRLTSGRERRKSPAVLTGRRFQSLAGVVHTPFSAVPLQRDLTAPAPVFPTITRALTPVTKEASSQMVPFGEQPGAHHLARPMP